MDPRSHPLHFSGFSIFDGERVRIKASCGMKSDAITLHKHLKARLVRRSVVLEPGLRLDCFRRLHDSLLYSCNPASFGSFSFFFLWGALPMLFCAFPGGGVPARHRPPWPEKCGLGGGFPMKPARHGAKLVCSSATLGHRPSVVSICFGRFQPQRSPRSCMNTNTGGRRP